MRRLGLTLAILGVVAAAAACGSSGSGTVPSQPAAPLSGAQADHERLQMMRLRLDDLGPNWQHDKPSDVSAMCHRHPKDVTVTAGSWKSRGVSYSYTRSIEIHSDAIVFATPADAEKTVAASTSPSVLRCLRREFQKAFRSGNDITLRGVSTRVLHRHAVADELAGFRVTVNLSRFGSGYRYFLDTFVVRQGRAVGEFTYGSALQPAPSSFEATLVRAIAQRGALAR
jgi:hypothetical protein